MRTLKLIGQGLEKLVIYLVLFLMAVLVSLVFIQVVLRYVFSNGLVWVEELDRYIFVWLMFLGIAMGVYKQKHIAITAVADRLKGFSKGIQLLVHIITGSFFAVLCWQGIQFVEVNMSGTAAVLPINLGIIYSIIPLSGFIAMIFIVVLIASSKEEKR
ncbi:TRAP transporter small permease [Rossellomorea aquimaris]|uniref:TRAP transporter small permease n=1 Tax=Rossellomorea aquimaris TaxID=189382 RepID=A0A5D4TL22_9BACI|nr:TRAP transporter small permease [Rossellomorea aquimaris]TYS76417.1 TRAP transporter small permease [Rossellomorea aquimaris]TYS83007.1 TRAP transporter small permease [Rossellomorea aquimaris]